MRVVRTGHSRDPDERRDRERRKARSHRLRPVLQSRTSGPPGLKRF